MGFRVPREISIFFCYHDWARWLDFPMVNGWRWLNLLILQSDIRPIRSWDTYPFISYLCRSKRSTRNSSANWSVRLLVMPHTSVARWSCWRYPRISVLWSSLSVAWEHTSVLRGSVKSSETSWLICVRPPLKPINKMLRASNILQNSLTSESFLKCQKRRKLKIFENPRTFISINYFSDNFFRLM